MEASPGGSEKLFKDPGVIQQGMPRVKTKTLSLDDVCAPARAFVRFVDCHPVARQTQVNRRAQTSEPAADNQNASLTLVAHPFNFKCLQPSR